MKISTITTLFLLLVSTQVNAQLTDTTKLKRFTINVLDSINGQPLSDLLISNPNDRNTFIGDKNGTLDLIVKNDFLQDTLYIIRQNYMTKKSVLTQL